MTVGIEDIRAAVRALGLQGQPLCIHVSLRSFGCVEGGADAIIDGLLTEGCTVMVAAFSPLEVPPPDDPAMRPRRNAIDYGASHSEFSGAGPVYSADSTEIMAYLGIVPRTLVNRPGRVRGAHPLDSFAALGPAAEATAGRQTAADVYAPLRALCELDGSVVMMGVGLTSMTLIHLAEAQAGRTLFRRWAKGPNGSVTMVEVGSCSDGFWQLDDALAPIERRTTVGDSEWRIFPAADALALATRAIQEQPDITHCGNEECIRCRDMVAGGPLFDRI